MLAAGAAPPQESVSGASWRGAAATGHGCGRWTVMYRYITCSHAAICDGENLPQNVAEHTDVYDDGWDRPAEPPPSNLDWMLSEPAHA
jgi:hypothetical protein